MMQCFLTLCTAVTIYFAEEVPLVAKPQHHISDSAPLLNGAQRPSVGLSDMHSEKPIDDHVNGISLQVGNEGTAETSMHQSLKPEEQNQVYHDGPGAVLVNLLTSLRHLPPGMHSVLLVMALCWVGATLHTYLVIQAEYISSLSCSKFSIHCLKLQLGLLPWKKRPGMTCFKYAGLSCQSDLGESIDMKFR